MPKVKNLVLILFLFYLPKLVAQIQQPLRFEIEKEDSQHLFNVVSAQEYGIVLFRENDTERIKDKRIWEVRMLDTELQEKWKRSD